MIFGKKAFDACGLTERIVSGLNAKRAEVNWTTEILRVLRELGRKKHFHVSPDARRQQGEYLVDMMWQRRSGSRTLPDVVLAVESERDFHDKDDFEKLMHIKAPQKLFVFRSKVRAKDGRSLIGSLEVEYMGVFTQHICGEEYILLEFAERERKALRYRYTVPRAASDGKRHKVKFREIRPPIPY